MADTDVAERAVREPDSPVDSLTAGQLGPKVPLGLAVLAVLISAAVIIPFMGLNIGLMALLAVVVYATSLYVLSRREEGSRRAADRMVTTTVSVAFALAMIPLISVIATVVTLGAERFDFEFFTTTMRNVIGVGGGAQHAIIGTAIITLLAGVISVPIGIMVAIYLVEYGKGALAKSITLFVDVMTGIPSIVAGLFAAGVFFQFGGPGTKNGFAGSVALSVLMVPIVIRSTEEMLKLVPNELREASYGLGVPKWRTITKIVLPTSIAGILTGITLAIARVVGETAPLLVAVGTTASLNLNPFSGRMESLPIFAFYNYVQPQFGEGREASIDRAWAASLVLMVMVMVLFGLARIMANALKPKGLK